MKSNRDMATKAAVIDEEAPKPNAAPETRGSWAGDAAGASLEREANAQRARDDASASAAQLHDRVDREGRAWLERVTAALHAAAATFNERAGGAVVRVDQLPSGMVALLVARDRQFVQVAPDWRPDDVRHVPGVIVAINNGRESRQPFRFLLVDDALVLDVDGQMLTPDGLARALAEPFLSSLSLGGR